MDNIVSNFVKMKSTYILIQQEYSKKYNELFDAAYNNICRKEYAKGGEIIHRGYYCPSPVLDIVIGNCNRGRILKRPPKENNYNYEYWFDSNNRLICVCEWNNIFGKFQISSTELFIYSTNNVLSLHYNHNLYLKDNSADINFISECFYSQNKIVKYVFALFFGECRCEEIRSESYEYKDSQIQSVMLEDYNFSAKILRRNKYLFEHDENGFLSSYKVQELDGVTIKNGYWDEHVFSIGKKRKI